MIGYGIRRIEQPISPKNECSYVLFNITSRDLSGIELVGQWPKRGANLAFSEGELLEIFGKKLGSVTHFWHRKHRKFRYFIENSPNFVKVEAFIA